MKDEVIIKLKEVIKIIYTPEQIGFDKAILEFIDSLSIYIDKEMEETPKLNSLLLEMQKFYMDKELIGLADCLYEIENMIDGEKEELL